jgi:hypothetical protein
MSPKQWTKWHLPPDQEPYPWARDRQDGKPPGTRRLRQPARSGRARRPWTAGDSPRPLPAALGGRSWDHLKHRTSAAISPAPRSARKGTQAEVCNIAACGWRVRRLTTGRGAYAGHGRWRARCSRGRGGAWRATRRCTRRRPSRTPPSSPRSSEPPPCVRTSWVCLLSSAKCKAPLHPAEALCLWATATSRQAGSQRQVCSIGSREHYIYTQQLGDDWMVVQPERAYMINQLDVPPIIVMPPLNYAMSTNYSHYKWLMINKLVPPGANRLMNIAKTRSVCALRKRERVNDCSVRGW